MDDDREKSIPWEPNPVAKRLPLPPAGEVETVEETPAETYIPPAPAPSVVAPQPTEFLTEEDFEPDDEEFERPGAQKLGIIGGKGVGKSYLFQAMVYRTIAGDQAGALTYYLERDAMRLFTAAGVEGDMARRFLRTGIARSVNRVNFVNKYKNWQWLPQTNVEIQQWYRLRLPFRTGWLGGTQSAMDVEFFEGSGEGFFQLQTLSPADWALWAKAYLNARIMVFCLPLWAAFPHDDLSDADWERRDEFLSGFEQVVQNYRDMHTRHRQTQPVSSILALTMADDRRGALRALHDRWISPYMLSPRSYLKQLRTGSGIARYLANARTVSEALHEEFSAVSDPTVSGIPQSLDFGTSRPWIVALSAIDGARLDQLVKDYPNPDDPGRARETRRAPTPVHVELPLLVALCERENALM